MARRGHASCFALPAIQLNQPRCSRSRYRSEDAACGARRLGRNPMPPAVELRTTEADEEVQAFALDRADERLRKGVCIGRPVRDLDDPSDL